MFVVIKGSSFLKVSKLISDLSKSIFLSFGYLPSYSILQQVAALKISYFADNLVFLNIYSML